MFDSVAARFQEHLEQQHDTPKPPDAAGPATGFFGNLFKSSKKGGRRTRKRRGAGTGSSRIKQPESVHEEEERSVSAPGRSPSIGKKPATSADLSDNVLSLDHETVPQLAASYAALSNATPSIHDGPAGLDALISTTKMALLEKQLMQVPYSPKWREDDSRPIPDDWNGGGYPKKRTRKQRGKGTGASRPARTTRRQNPSNPPTAATSVQFSRHLTGRTGSSNATRQIRRSVKPTLQAAKAARIAARVADRARRVARVTKKYHEQDRRLARREPR